MTSRYQIVAPQTPGAQPTAPAHMRATRIDQARRMARNAYRHRKDLTWQDVRIEKLDGQLVEYAGPSR